MDSFHGGYYFSWGPCLIKLAGDLTFTWNLEKDVFRFREMGPQKFHNKIPWLVKYDLYFGQML